MIHCRSTIVATLAKFDLANDLEAICYTEGLLTAHQHGALLKFSSGNSRLLVDTLANNIRASPHFFYEFMFVLMEQVDWSKDLIYALKKKYEGTKCLHVMTDFPCSLLVIIKSSVWGKFALHFLEFCPLVLSN